MNPKMTAKDAALFLGCSPKQVYQRLIELDLPFTKLQSTITFGFNTAKQLFKLEIKPKSIAFQIVKGGTGKTSLACAFAVRANLYGLRVLCVDLDQQGNLTQSFGVDAEKLPVMIDILAEGYKFEDAITRVYPGLDLLSSRIENALIDDVIKLKQIDLQRVYRDKFEELKSNYDLIVIDCPPNLGQSVAAIALGVDCVVSPVVPEQFAITGLQLTYEAIAEIQQSYGIEIPFKIILNKLDARTTLSQQALRTLYANKNYAKNLLNIYIRVSQDFPNAIAKQQSIYDILKPTIAKSDVDQLVHALLESKVAIKNNNKPKMKVSSGAIL